MAPRNTKAKKAADVKLAPKAGRGKEKILEVAEFESLDTKLEDNVVLVAEKKTKQKKKPANDDNDQELNGNVEDVVPAKKGKKKNEPKTDDKQKFNKIGEGNEKETYSDDQINTNGHSEDGGKVRKKKNETNKSNPNDTGKGKTDNHENKEALKEVDDKPKTAKSRGRKALPKIDKAEEDIIDEEDVKIGPQGKGKKKVQTKVKEQFLETKQEDFNEMTKELGTKEAEVKEEVEEKPEPKTKGRKVKKTQDKAVQEVQDVMEEAPAAKKRKVAKKGKGDSKEEDDTPEVLPVKAKRGQKKTAVSEEDKESEHVTSKRGRKPANDKGTNIKNRYEFPETSQNDIGKQSNLMKNTQDSSTHYDTKSTDPNISLSDFNHFDMTKKDVEQTHSKFNCMKIPKVSLVDVSYKLLSDTQSKKREDSAEEKDNDKLFVLSLVKDIKNISENYKIEAKKKILEVINKYRKKSEAATSMQSKFLHESSPLQIKAEHRLSLESSQTLSSSSDNNFNYISN